MSLQIDYESSSDEEQVGQKRKTETVLKERSKMPKLPSFFDTAQQLSLQAQYQGKIRSVPHRENSWATYVYFKVDLTEDKKSILKYRKALEEIPEQHVSLSRTVYLKQHQLESFVAAIKSRMQDHRSFHISFAQLANLTNDEKTRSFLTLEISKGYNELSEYTKLVDKVMIEYHQPIFYDPPRFHTSIAWALDEKEIDLSNIPPSCINHISNNDYHLSRLYIKQGNRLNYIDLQ